jgi:hypothetical protein
MLSDCNIYHLSQSVNNDIGAIVEAKIIARSAYEAATLHPNGGTAVLRREQWRRYASDDQWCAVQDVSVRLIGIACHSATVGKVIMIAKGRGNNDR